MNHAPIIKPEYLESMWFETEDGKHRVSVDFQNNGGMDYGPSLEMYPIACCRSGIEVRTDVYMRRSSDGGYGGKDRICTASSTAAEDLVLAMALGSNGQKKYRLREALTIAAESCEGCMNVLAHQYGLEWGYAYDSEEQQKVGTSCHWCRP